MDEVELLPTEIAEAIAAGATVITGNQRAARTLRHAFDRQNHRLGHSSWQPANILAWDAWTTKLWQRLLVDGYASQLLMNSAQELTLWRQVLEADNELLSLRSKDSLAALASEAWDKLCSYNGQTKVRSLTASPDTRAFQRWISAFQRRCRNDGLLAQADLQETLRAFLQTGHLQLEASQIVLVGFDSTTPAQMRLIEAVRLTGCRVDAAHLTVPAQEVILARAEDEQQELFSAAQWVRSYVEDHPNVRVAVIVPALSKQRAEIDRVFREVLAPESQNIAAPTDALPYEFSLGVSLAETPMVIVALSLLQWPMKPLPIDRVTHLLLSPYFGASPKEQGARAEFDAFELRKKQMLRPDISLDWLSAALDKSKRKQKLGSLSEIVHEMRLVAAGRLEGTDRNSHSEWATRMRELLHAARWGASRVESSTEFQARNKWEGALDELTTLDFDSTRVSFISAFESLQRIVRQTMFAPESREAPVQVMGPLETAGSTFDAAWFLRAGDLTWPAAISSNPLLSWQLKKELGIPGADFAIDNQFASKVIKRTSQSAKTVIFSYALECAEGRQRPSPALEGLPLSEVPIQQLIATEPHYPITELETIEDSATIPPPPDRVIRGGAKILQLQAACGFRAFAEQRLWSAEVESVEPGIDEKENGTIVHRALEYFWEEIKTQNALKLLTSFERATLLDRCITRALKSFMQISETLWDKAYIATQHTRLHKLLTAWLDLELQRPPFEVKLSEKSFDDVHIGPLRLSVRMDRVDKIDGGELLIDYKTGSASPNDWLTERPNAPQLPLYAVLSDPEQLRGVAFGLVRAGENLDLTGYAATDGILPHPTRLKAPSLEAQVEDWHRILSNLAEQFYSGDARVAPKKYPKTCSHCAQRILCRLDTSLLEEEDVPMTEVDRG
jgi:ATP-dependent helicase/nuclease subunit B